MNLGLEKIKNINQLFLRIRQEIYNIRNDLVKTKTCYEHSILINPEKAKQCKLATNALNMLSLIVERTETAITNKSRSQKNNKIIDRFINNVVSRFETIYDIVSLINDENQIDTFFLKFKYTVQSYRYLINKCWDQNLGSEGDCKEVLEILNVFKRNVERAMYKYETGKFGKPDKIQIDNDEFTVAKHIYVLLRDNCDDLIGEFEEIRELVKHIN